MRRAGGEENRAAGVRGPQERIEGSDQPPIGGDVERHHRVPGALVDLMDRRDRAEQAGIADEHVELAEALVERRPQPIESVEVLQIEGYERRARTGGADLVVEFLERALRAGQRHDVGARAGELQRGRTADAAGRAGDDRDAVFERPVHRLPLNPLRPGSTAVGASPRRDRSARSGSPR